MAANDLSTDGLAVQPANHFALAVNAVEIALSVGALRPVIDPATGHPSQVGTLRWMAAYLMSPTAAKQLSLSLTEAIHAYEAQFGAIPMDPGFQVGVADPQPAS